MKTYAELQSENQALKDLMKVKDERIDSLVRNMDRLSDLINRLLLKFKKPQ